WAYTFAFANIFALGYLMYSVIFNVADGWTDLASFIGSLVRRSKLMKMFIRFAKNILITFILIFTSFPGIILAHSADTSTYAIITIPEKAEELFNVSITI